MRSFTKALQLLGLFGKDLRGGGAKVTHYFAINSHSYSIFFLYENELNWLSYDWSLMPLFRLKQGFFVPRISFYSFP